MKKILAILAITLSSSVFAAGPYDGIWSAGGDLGVTSLHENDGFIVAVRLGPDQDFWEALQGARVGDYAKLTTISGYSGVHATVEVKFTSENIALFRQISCVPITLPCALPNGITIISEKIW